MIPGAATSHSTWGSLPRIRGGVSKLVICNTVTNDSSPHARAVSIKDGIRKIRVVALPALAGVFPALWTGLAAYRVLPRPCGGVSIVDERQHRARVFPVPAGGVSKNAYMAGAKCKASP